MVYLDLSVESVDLAVEFYSKKLGIFSYQPDRRLICNLGVELILDLRERGSKSHIACFGQSQHVPASFWIHVGGDGQCNEIEIYEHLRSNGVQFEDIGNLGGHFLKFIDPSNNKFTMHAHLGVFK